MRWPKYNAVVPEVLDGLLLPHAFTRALTSPGARAVPTSRTTKTSNGLSPFFRRPTCRTQQNEHRLKYRGVVSFSSSTKKQKRNSDGNHNYSHHIRSYNSHYINGKWTNPFRTGTIDVIDPNHGRVVATVPRGTREDTLAAIAAAKKAKQNWRHETTPLERMDYIRLFLDRFRTHQRVNEIVDRLSVELGCTPAFARNVQAMALVHHTQTLLDLLDDGNNDHVSSSPFVWEEAAGRSTIVKEAVGVVGAITPWNYPLHQITLKVVPALVAGCTVVLKPSEVTPLVAYSVAEILDEAGLPDGVFNMVMGTGPECGQVLAEHPDVDLVSFTGSTAAGRVLARATSTTMKTLRTELGGKSAAILLDDADLERVVPAFVKQLTSNTGQSCNALSRMLVPRNHHETVLDIAAKTMLKEVVGESTTEGVTLGPLVSQTQYDTVRSYIRNGIADGATLVTGGLEQPEGLEGSAGFFVAPTLFGNVEGNMVIAQEEIFGPVLSVIPYDTEEEAIAVANGTPFGLNNAVASRDIQRALQVAARLESGMVMVNKATVDLQAPFGGYKQSGNAREWGLAGLEEYLITKTVNVPLEKYRAIVYGDNGSQGGSGGNR